MTISAKQLTANRKNAKKSTCPKTDKGKKMVANNAVKQGLYNNDIIFEENALFASMRAQRDNLNFAY